MEEIDEINYELYNINNDLKDLLDIKTLINTINEYINENKLLKVAIENNMESLDNNQNKLINLTNIYGILLLITLIFIFITSIISLPLSIIPGILFTTIYFLSISNNKNINKLNKELNKDILDLSKITNNIDKYEEKLDIYLSEYPSIDEDINKLNIDKSKFESKKRYIEYNYKKYIDNIIDDNLKRERI